MATKRPSTVEAHARHARPRQHVRMTRALRATMKSKIETRQGSIAAVRFVSRVRAPTASATRTRLTSIAAALTVLAAGSERGAGLTLTAPDPRRCAILAFAASSRFVHAKRHDRATTMERVFLLTETLVLVVRCFVRTRAECVPPTKLRCAPALVRGAVIVCARRPPMVLTNRTRAHASVLQIDHVHTMVTVTNAWGVRAVLEQRSAGGATAIQTTHAITRAPVLHSLVGGAVQARGCVSATLAS